MYTGVMNEFSIFRKSLPGDGSPIPTLASIRISLSLKAQDS